MARLRVHELAKELNMNNKDLIDRILRLGIQVKNHMSTLTESTVDKIRQQFSESKTETVEEKRVGRVVVRKRKKIPGEAEESPALAEAEGQPMEIAEAPVQLAEGEQQPSVMEVTSPEVTADEMPTPPSMETQIPAVGASEKEAELPRVPEEEIAPSAEPETPSALETSGPPLSGAPISTSVPPLKTLEAVASGDEVAPSAQVEVAPLSKAEASAQAVEFENIPVESPTSEPAPQSTAEVLLEEEEMEESIDESAEGAEGALEGEELSEEDGKEKKAKKRRRKKVRKEEPARIIKLPEIIPVPEEVEEEPVLAIVPPRFKETAEEIEAKEIARKKRAKPEEPPRESPDRKKQRQRKEVFEKEALYSKKELAAHAGRGRLRDRESPREMLKAEPGPTKALKRRVRIDEAITVANFAKQIGVKAGEVIKKLLLLGVPASINQALDYDTAAVLATEFDFEVEKVGFEEEEILQMQEDRTEDLILRPPVITVMGHVDHGKTSLLDAIRDTNVIGGEAGGITQHIGAYYVKLENGDVVFLDTPGHEAFTSMRARGAKVTDIVILLVAADDGVMPQTVEAINHAKAANVPIIVAINKIDKPNANVERVKRQLADQGLMGEEWGGSTTMVEISAKKRLGIDDLLEMVLLQAEIMELKSNPQKPARGRVIESKLDKGRGPVATILIQEGTLRAGDIYVCGTNSGRVRNMFNERGQKLEIAGPSTPVEVLGFSGVPNAGDQFIVIADEKQAKQVAEHRQVKLREKELTRSSKVTLESLFEQIQEGEVKELNLILKTDVHGSLEAISDSLVKLSTPEVKVCLIHTATGAITESDVLLASASNAIIIAFNIRAESKVMELAEQEKVDIRFYDVIYQVLSDVQDAMVGMLEPEYKEVVIGRAEVRQTFRVPKMGMIAGSYVLDGRAERNAKIRVLREQVVIYDGKLGSLRRFKDDVKEVKSGFECGIGIENFNDLKIGDILEFYEMEEVKATLTVEGQDKKPNA